MFQELKSHIWLLSQVACYAQQVGEAGLGKTTFVQNLQAAFQPDGPSHPSVAPSQDEGANIYELFEQSPQELCTEVTVNTETSKFHYLLQVRGPCQKDHSVCFALEPLWTTVSASVQL